MKNLEKISPLQTILLLSLCRIAIVLLWFHFENQDVWITEIVALFYVAVLAVPLIFLSKQFPQLTPIEYLQVIAGQFAGKLLGVFYAGFFLFIAVTAFSLFDNIIRPINFPETPDYAIILLALVTCTYGVYKGLECIVRSAEIFTPLILTVIVFYAVLQIPEMNFKVFLPVLADSSFSKINFLAFSTAARMNEIIFLAMLIPAINKKGNTITILFWIALLICVFSLIIIVPTLAGLGLELAKKTFDPYYLFIKQINVYDFITRIEFLIVFAWNISMFLKISLMLYLATMSLVQVFDLKNRKILIIPISILVFISTLKTDILKSVVVFKIIESYIPYINLLFIFVIPVAMSAIFLLKKSRKGKSGCNI